MSRWLLIFWLFCILLAIPAEAQEQVAQSVAIKVPQTLQGPLDATLPEFCRCYDQTVVLATAPTGEVAVGWLQAFDNDKVRDPETGNYRIGKQVLERPPRETDL